MLTVDGQDPQTGSIVISGSVEGTSGDLDVSLMMAPLLLDPETLPDFDALQIEAEIADAEVWDYVETAPADFTGTVDGEAFAYDLQWYLGYSSSSGVGFTACDEKAGF